LPEDRGKPRKPVSRWPVAGPAGCVLTTSQQSGKQKFKKIPWPKFSLTRLNNIYEFSPYLKENTTLQHYKDQFVNAVQENNHCLQ
jgi:hypothetical protein